MKKYEFYGGTAVIGMLLFYLITLTIFQGFDHAVDQFSSQWYLLLPLALGFGAQVAIYSYIRLKHHKVDIVKTGGASAGSMIACCVHHVVDILPIVGLSGLFLFMADYQQLFLYAGIFSSLVGISMMLQAVQKHELYNGAGFLSKVLKFDMKEVRRAVLYSALVIMPVAFFNMQTVAFSGAMSTLTDDRNSVSVDATPSIAGNDLKFAIGINTHSVQLNFNLKDTAYLEANGKVYRPYFSDGPTNQHHNSNVILFNGVDTSKGFKLTIKNVAGIDRMLEWR